MGRPVRAWVVGSRSCRASRCSTPVASTPTPRSWSWCAPGATPSGRGPWSSPMTASCPTGSDTSGVLVRRLDWLIDLLARPNPDAAVALSRPARARDIGPAQRPTRHAPARPRREPPVGIGGGRPPRAPRCHDTHRARPPGRRPGALEAGPRRDHQAGQSAQGTQGPIGLRAGGLRPGGRGRPRPWVRGYLTTIVPDIPTAPASPWKRQ